MPSGAFCPATAEREPRGAKTGIGFESNCTQNNSCGAAGNRNPLIYIGGSAFAVAEAIPYIETK